MDFTFLSDRIKDQLAELKPEIKPLCVIRGSGGFNGEPGESYVIPYRETIFLYNRKFSEPDFECKCLKLIDIDQLLLHNEAFSALLTISTAGELLKLKISSAEIPNAELMLENFENCREVEEQFAAAPEPEEVAEGAIPAMLGLVVILMFIATVDNEIAEEEQEFINKFCGEDKELYDKAYEYYQNSSFEEILSALALGEQQKMCYLANILELSMVDGVYDSREQKLIKAFTKSKGMDKDQVRAIEDVLLIKNQLSILN